jgi:ribosomal protein L37AE/L43A
MTPAYLQGERGSRVKLFIAVVVGAATWLLAALLVGPATCRDGWNSPSIGHSGACSHHGGVSRNSTVLFGLIAGFAAYFVAKRIGVTDTGGVISSIREARTSVTDRAQSNPPCPLCGKVMVRARLAKGGWMWACSQFPSCRGFIDPVQKEGDSAA